MHGRDLVSEMRGIDEVRSDTRLVQYWDADTCGESSASKAIDTPKTDTVQSSHAPPLFYPSLLSGSEPIVSPTARTAAVVPNKDLESS